MSLETKSHELTPADRDRALAGDEKVLKRLIDVLTPVIQARVARGLLLRRQAAAGRPVRQEVQDLTQEVFLALLENDGRVLRSWDPERGLSLPNFVGLVAERQLATILRSGKKNPWKEDPTLDANLDREWPEQGPEKVTASREELRLLFRRLAEELSPLGRHLFELIFVRELAVDDVVARTRLSADAVYAWRSRLRRLAKKIFRELSDPAAVPRNNKEERSI